MWKQKVMNSITKIFLSIFHYIGLCPWNVVNEINGATSRVVFSKFSFLVSIVTVVFLLFCILERFLRPIRGIDNLYQSNLSAILHVFNKLLVYAKVLYVFLPVWIFLKKSKIILLKLEQAQQHIINLDPTYKNEFIAARPFKRFALTMGVSGIIIGLIIHYVSKTALIFKFQSISWIDFVSNTVPSVYGIICITHLTIWLYLLESRFMQLQKILCQMKQ